MGQVWRKYISVAYVLSFFLIITLNHDTTTIRCLALVCWDIVVGTMIPRRDVLHFVHDSIGVSKMAGDDGPDIVRNEICCLYYTFSVFHHYI